MLFCNKIFPLGISLKIADFSHIRFSSLHAKLSFQMFVLTPSVFCENIHDCRIGRRVRNSGEPFSQPQFQFGVLDIHKHTLQRTITRN